ncbi:hypothetical protein YB2330_004980 [Saitoella coloradoensis]
MISRQLVKGINRPFRQAALPIVTSFQQQRLISVSDVSPNAPFLPPGADDEPNKSGLPNELIRTITTTVASLACLGLAGYGYHKYYKHLVLAKIKNAFTPGPDDPALLAYTVDKATLDKDHLIQRPEHERIRKVMTGEETGHYYLMIGEKGVGKTTMVLDVMHEVQANGISAMEAHRDPEIFRTRLGKALDFEYAEDFIGGLFSIKGQRESTALLDIERAFNKLEKVAVQHRKVHKKPLVFVINGLHFLQDNDDGNALLELLQQRAETWAASGILTMIFNSDDYWVYERMKQHAARMILINVTDLDYTDATSALQKYRLRYFGETVSEPELTKVWKLVGGRLQFLNRIAKEEDMLQAAKDINEMEKTWLWNRCSMIEDHDDDVMDQQKYASAAFTLALALVKAEQEAEDAEGPMPETSKLPSLPLYRARQVMTRADFIQSLDSENIFHIDTKSNVRADSVPMMNAFREICSEVGFEEMLENVKDRIDEIESLHRTRELTFKDLPDDQGKVRVYVDKGGEKKMFSFY